MVTAAIPFAARTRHPAALNPTPFAWERGTTLRPVAAGSGVRTVEFVSIPRRDDAGEVRRSGIRVERLDLRW